MYLEKMKELFTDKKYLELEKFCSSQLEFHPSDADLLFFYASALEANGKFTLAKKTFLQLFDLTKDRIFLVCESISEFAEGDEQGGLDTLNSIWSDETNVEKLFFAFDVAMKNDEGELALKLLQKCFLINRKKTIIHIQDMFEKLHEHRTEKIMAFLNLIGVLNSIPED